MERPRAVTACLGGGAWAVIACLTPPARGATRTLRWIPLPRRGRMSARAERPFTPRRQRTASAAGEAGHASPGPSPSGTPRAAASGAATPTRRRRPSRPHRGKLRGPPALRTCSTGGQRRRGRPAPRLGPGPRPRARTRPRPGRSRGSRRTSGWTASCQGCELKGSSGSHQTPWHHRGPYRGARARALLQCFHRVRSFTRVVSPL